MLSFANYTTASKSFHLFLLSRHKLTFTCQSVDVWSVGCVLAELLGGRPIFKGKDYIDQLNIVLHFLGTPSDRTLSRVGSPRVCLHFFPSSYIFPSRRSNNFVWLVEFIGTRLYSFTSLQIWNSFPNFIPSC